MPSAMTGLVAFSITLLLLGTSLYTAALPTMVTTSKQDGELTPDEMQAALTEAQSSLADDGSWPSTAEAAPDGNEAAGDAQEGSGSSALGGSTLNELSGLSGGGSLDGQTDASASGQPQNNQADSSQQGGTEGGGSVSPAPAPQPSDPDDPPTPDYDAEKDQRFHAYLVQKAQSLDGYVSEANACASAFQADALTGSLSQRQANLRAVDSLESRVFNDFAAVVNTTEYQNSTKWQASYEALIVCYRLLYEYLSSYHDAWTINVGYEDPSAHVDEFMAPVSEANGKLASFRDYSAKVVL